MCGVIGIVGTQIAAEEAYQALLLMQHRGQDAAGILTNDLYSRNIHVHKDSGLVDSVFDKDNLGKLKGQLAIGHTRYSTIGKSLKEDIQPTTINFPYGLGLAHNGNIVNLNELKLYLKDSKNRHIYSNNDSEVLINIIADELSQTHREDFHFDQLARGVEVCMEQAIGAYAVVGVIAGKGFFAFRDPHGIRPISFGKKKNKSPLNDEKNIESYCFSSESNSIPFLGYEYIRDLDPGELVFVDTEGNFHSKIIHQKEKKQCMFEWVYFSNPESSIDNNSIYSARLESGKELAVDIQKLISNAAIIPDVVVPIPETSRVSAIAIAEKIGVPYRELLIKNRYIQRSFILNDETSRQKAVERKLSPVKSEIQGKNILLVDDSIVRGTTSKHIIQILKKNGAKKVYIASACPPIISPCYFGIDFPFKEKLLAYKQNIDEMEKTLKADKIIYLKEESLKKAIGTKSLCTACLNGNYPMELPKNLNLNDSRVGENDSAEELHERQYT